MQTSIDDNDFSWGIPEAHTFPLVLIGALARMPSQETSSQSK
jgi:hypothetical protein